MKGVSFGEERIFLEPPQGLLMVMDRRNIRMLVNLTGGVGSGLREGVARYDRAHAGRFFTFTEPWYSRLLEPNARTRTARAG